MEKPGEACVQPGTYMAEVEARVRAPVASSPSHHARSRSMGLGPAAASMDAERETNGAEVW